MGFSPGPEPLEGARAGATDCRCHILQRWEHVHGESQSQLRQISQTHAVPVDVGVLWVLLDRAFCGATTVISIGHTVLCTIATICLCLEATKNQVIILTLTMAEVYT